MDDDEILTMEEAAWIVRNRESIRESGPEMGAVIGLLEGEEAVKFLELVFPGSADTKTVSKTS